MTCAVLRKFAADIIKQKRCVRFVTVDICVNI